MTPELPIPNANHEFLVPVPGAGGSTPAGGRLDDLARDRLMQAFGFVAEPDALRFGTCPECGQKRLTALGAMPLSVYCARTAKCGWEEPTVYLLPELFAYFCARFPSTPEDPAATATAYLRYVRGFDVGRIAGFYTQGTYWNPRGDRGTATVRFELAEGLAWEHLIDPVTLDRGSPRETVAIEAATGKFDGLWWPVPGQDLSQANEVWIVTNIFDALALHLHGVCAVSIMASTNYPAAALTALAAQCMGRGRPDLVWALGGDPEGRKYTRKWVKRARAEGWPCKAAAIPQKGRRLRNWNDLHLIDKLYPYHLEEYGYHGALQIAPSAKDKALLIYNRKEMREFGFDFDHRIFWFKLDLEKYEKEAGRYGRDGENMDEDKAREEALKASSVITELVKCLPEPLYFQRNEVTDESWYYFRFRFPHDGAPVKSTFTAKQLANNSEFKARLMHVARGSVWKGKPNHLEQLADRWIYNIKEVQTIDYIGYSDKHGAYIYTDYAVKEGKVYPLNEEDYFDLPNLAVKSLSHSVKLDINTDLTQFRTDWVSTLWTAFGVKGFVALAFWLGTLFAEQIREKHSSYPFLELVGEAGSGKSTLLFFLWSLLGRDYEGFDATEATSPGLSRAFNQVSNLPMVLLESDRADQSKTAQGRPAKGLDVESLKKLYNGNAFRTRGERTLGNETYAPPFRSALVISQNLEVAGSQAVLERLIHLVFDSSGHNANTRAAAEKLEQIPIRDVSGFLIKAICQEKAIFAEYLKRYEQHAETLRKDPLIRKARIVRNHAQMMALVDCLPLVVPISDEQRAEVRGFLLELAIERQQAINQDHPLVSEFWDIFDYIEDSSDSPVLNHSTDPALIAINLVHFEEVVNSRRGKAPPRADLMRVLKTSRNPKFVEIKPVHSGIHARYNKNLAEGESLKPKNVKCWVFERK
jgi:hypothetical protein